MPRLVQTYPQESSHKSIERRLNVCYLREKVSVLRGRLRNSRSAKGVIVYVCISDPVDVQVPAGLSGCGPKIGVDGSDGPIFHGPGLEAPGARAYGVINGTGPEICRRI